MCGKKELEILLTKQEEVKMRTCTQCGEEKQLTEENFYKEETAKEGYRTKCKDCAKGKYRHKNDEEFDILEWYENKSKIFKNNWRFEDIKWIYNNYLNINKQDLIKKFPNSNYKTIHNIICQWNIRKIEKNDNWSEEDIQFLIENYPNMSQIELERYFVRRTWDAIKNKAAKLSICRNDETLSKIKSASQIGHKVSDEAKRRMSRNRRGKKTANYRGGISPLHPFFRSMLYEWKLDSFKKYNFKCAILGVWTKQLEVHHVYENFSDLMVETLEELKLPVNKTGEDYTEKETELIYKTFLKKNYDTGLGVPLDRRIHKLFHKCYGSKKNNIQQFKEFIIRLKMGEFEEYFIDNNIILNHIDIYLEEIG